MIFLLNDDNTYRFAGMCVAIKSPLVVRPCEARIFVASQHLLAMGFLWHGPTDKDTILVCPD